MRIGIDFDDVISSTAEPLFQALGEYFGIDLKYQHQQQTKWYALEKILNVTAPEVASAYQDISSRYSFHKRIALAVGCQKALIKLKKQRHLLFVISARQTWELPYSTAWLKYHGILPLIAALIHKPTDDQPAEEFKRTIAKELNLDFFIEDAPHFALAIASAGIPVILFDAPYNRDIKLLKNMYRVMGWREVPKIMSRIRQGYGGRAKPKRKS